jgi:glycosyltransferase involved in cell wall biosynthesis
VERQVSCSRRIGKRSKRKVLEMNILIIHASEIKKAMQSDTDVYIEGFKELGHNVVVAYFDEEESCIAFNAELEDDINKVDIIWAPYEREIIIGLFLKDLLKKPLVGHYEWVPPWRINAEDPLKWGYDEQGKKKLAEEISDWKKYYSFLAKRFEMCDYKTCPTDYCFNTIKPVYPPLSKKNFSYKPYAIDEAVIMKNKIDCPIKNQIITISRLVTHKKMNHMIQALSMIENPPQLVIIGDGKERENLISLAKKLNVDIKILGHLNKEKIGEEIQKSLFGLHLSSSLPVGECALFNVPSIMYTHPNMVEKHGNIGLFVEEDNIEELAEKIKLLLEDSVLREQLGKDSHDKIYNKETGLMLKRDSCEEMLKIFEKVIGSDEKHTNI